MAIRWFDGGEVWGLSGYFDIAYFAADASTTTPGRILPGLYKIAVQSGRGVLTTPSLSVQNTWFSGFGFKADTLGVTNKWKYIALSGATEQCRLEMWETATNTAELRLYRGATLIDTSSTFTTNVWSYIEVKFVVRTGVNGSYEVRLNESTIMTGSGVDLANSGSDGADVFTIGDSDQASDLDDWYILDDTGATNVTFLGEQVSSAIFPTSDGHQNDFAPSTGGVNFSLVDDPPTTLDATDYVSTNTVNDEDYYGYGNMPATGIGTINAMRITNGAHLEAAGTRTIQPRYYNGVTEFDLGDDFVVDGTTLFENTVIAELNPDTLVKWTKSDIDAAEFGIRMTL